VDVIPEIVAQYAEGAAFLWLLRDVAVVAPHYSLRSLAKLDERVEAHIDGLRIAGREGWQHCHAQLDEWGEAGEVFAAALLAVEGGKRGAWMRVVDVGTTDAAAARGLVSALGWLPYERAARPIAELLGSEAPALRCVGLAASAAHRLASMHVLSAALGAHNADVRARALRAAGEIGLHDLLPAVQGGMIDVDAQTRFLAARSAVLLGSKSAVSTLQKIAAVRGPSWEQAVVLAARAMGREAGADWQRELARQPDAKRAAVLAAEAVGDPTALPWLVDQMRQPETARIAGEAFSTITGIDIGRSKLEGSRPDGFESGPTDDPEDDNVAMDPDDELRWPDADRVAEWWHIHQGEFSKGQRYLLGKTISRDSLGYALRTGSQRQRVAAALEMALTEPCQPLFEVRAPAQRQLVLLGLG